MEEILMKKSDSKFIGIKEIVVVTLFSVLTFVVSMLTAMTFAASVHLQELVDTMLSLYRSPVIVAMVALVLIVSSVIGMFIGSRMMKKHFQPAGVA